MHFIKPCKIVYISRYCLQGSVIVSLYNIYWGQISLEQTKIIMGKKGNRKLPKNPFYQFFKVTHFYFTHNSTFWGLTPCTNFGDTLAMSTVKRRDQFTVNSENHDQFTYVWYVLVHKVENKSSLMSLSWHMMTFFLLFELLFKGQEI